MRILVALGLLVGAAAAAAESRSVPPVPSADQHCAWGSLDMYPVVEHRGVLEAGARVRVSFSYEGPGGIKQEYVFLEDTFLCRDPQSGVDSDKRGWLQIDVPTSKKVLELQSARQLPGIGFKVEVIDSKRPVTRKSGG